jgi:hypothetical protein
MVEATRVMSRHFVLVNAALLSVMFGMRGLELASHRLLGKAEAWPNLLMVFVVCYPLSFLANCVVSAMTLRTIEGGLDPSFGQICEVGKFPGLFPSMLRWLIRVLFWIAPAIGVLLLVIVVVDVAGVSMRFATGHAGAGGRAGVLSKRATHGLLLAWLVLYEGMLSRYTFLMPMIARARAGSKEILEKSVAVAKAHWLTLWIGAMSTCALSMGVYELMKAAIHHVSAGPALSEGFRAVELLMVGILSTWYWIFTTILMIQATEPVDPLVNEQPVIQ